MAKAGPPCVSVGDHGQAPRCSHGLLAAAALCGGNGISALSCPPDTWSRCRLPASRPFPSPLHFSALQRLQGDACLLGPSVSPHQPAGTGARPRARVRGGGQPQRAALQSDPTGTDGSPPGGRCHHGVQTSRPGRRTLGDEARPRSGDPGQLPGAAGRRVRRLCGAVRTGPGPVLAGTGPRADGAPGGVEGAALATVNDTACVCGGSGRTRLPLRWGGVGTFAAGKRGVTRPADSSGPCRAHSAAWGRGHGGRATGSPARSGGVWGGKAGCSPESRPAPAAGRCARAVDSALSKVCASGSDTWATGKTQKATWRCANEGKVLPFADTVSRRAEVHTRQS